MGAPGVFMNLVADVSEIMAFRTGCLSSQNDLLLSPAVVSPSRVSSHLPDTTDGETMAGRSNQNSPTPLESSPCCC